MPFVPLPGVLRERALAKLLPQNGLLAVLPDEVRARLLPHLAIADLPAGHELGQPDGSFARAYFPVTGVVSLLQRAADGGERVGALVGHEGVVGLPPFLRDAGVTRVAVQCAGYALALGREQLLDEWGRGGAFMRVLMRYGRAVAAQKVVLSACRAQHSLEQQLSTLLVLSVDRLPGQEALLEQETAARGLGVATPQLAAAVERLCAVGAATWRRPGLLAAHDGAPLRSLACACHARVTSEYQRLLPADGNPLAAVPFTAEAAARRAVTRDAVLARGAGDRPHGG